MKRWSFGWKRIAGAGAIVALCAFAFVWFGMMGTPTGQQPNAGKAPSSDPAALLANEESAASSDDGSAATAAADEEASEPYGGAPYVPGVVLVSLEEGADPEAALSQLIADTGYIGLSVQEVGTGYALLALPEGVTTEAAVSAIGASDAVGAAQPNFIYTVQDDASADADESLGAYAPATIDALTTQANPNDPFFADQWALDSINASQAWDKVPSGRTVGVAILDEGFNVAHEDLKNQIVDKYNSAGGARTDVSPSYKGSGYTQGHGTHVAGIVGAQTNNGKGIAGVADNHANLWLVKVYDSGGTATSTTLINAYEYLFTKAKANNIRVINCSVGSKRANGPTDDDTAVHTRIDKAFHDYNMVTVCSAGSEGGTGNPTAYNFPSDYETAVSVMALARSGSGVVRYASSSYNAPTNTADGPGKNICAPGGNIMSTFWINGDADNDAKYGNLSGSSMAAPHVAGVLALMFAANPSMTAPEAVSRLYESATDLGPTGWDPGYGFGEVNAAAALSQDAIDIGGAHVTWPACTFTGEKQNPTPTVKVNGVALDAGKDFTVSYPTDSGSYMAGAHNVKINAKSVFYKGSTTSTYTIDKADIAGATVTLSQASYKYDGKAKEPDIPTATFGNRTIYKGVDYTISYKNNIDPGTATVVLTGMRNFTGTKEVAFQITGNELDKCAGAAKAANFTDLNSNEWYMQTGAGKGAFPNTNTLYLDYVIYEHLMSGYAGTSKFGPTDTLTRADAATIIYRLTYPNSDATTKPAYYSKANTSGMNDVETGKYYTAAVNWCAKNKVITGFEMGDHNEFRPYDTVTREQIATIIARYSTKVLNKASVSTDITGYRDYKQISTWARSGVSYCLSKGIMAGYTGTNMFYPQEATNRAQMSKIIAVVATSA